jgi:hypothetical protein
MWLSGTISSKITYSMAPPAKASAYGRSVSNRPTTMRAMIAQIGSIKPESAPAMKLPRVEYP